MYFLLSGCQNPDILRPIYFSKMIVEIICTILPVILVIYIIIDLLKAIVAKNDEDMHKITNTAVKRIFNSVLIFFVPLIVNLFMNMLDGLGVNYAECLTNANPSDIQSYQAVKNTEDELEKAILEARRNADLENAKVVKANAIIYSVSRSASLTTLSGTTNTVDNYTNNPEKVTSFTNASVTEPDAFTAFNYWYKKGQEIYNPNNYIAMYDKSTGYRLGAWPKNANLDSLSGNVKTYGPGNLIYPLKAEGGRSYDHAGIDLVAKVGTPIYAVADGTISFSEWGHTVNKGQTETAYSVWLKLDKPFKYTGEWAKGIGAINKTTKTDNVIAAYYTHMSGIRYRNGSVHVKQGDLIGWSGLANSCPHLHLSLYDTAGNYQLSTGSMKSMYDTLKRVGVDIEAGG